MSIAASPRVRGARWRLTAGLAAAFIVGSGVLVGTPLHAAAATTVTLTASSSTVSAGSPVTLTATVSPAPTGGWITIDEVGTSNEVGFCYTSPCNGSATYPTASTHTFQATFHLSTGNTLSNTVSVTWVGTATYSLSLSASTTQAISGQVVTVTATASPNVPTGYHVDIWETTAGSPNESGQICYSTPCTLTASHDSGQYSYHAFLDNDSSIVDPPTPSSVIATAGGLVVTWTRPSALFCAPPTVPVLDGSAAGVQVTLDVKVGVSQSAVCFRVDNGAGDAVGGAVLVNTAVSPTVPTVTTGNLCNGAQGNTLAGPHPLADVNVLGQPVFLDTYAGPDSNGTVWVCESVDGMADTVVVPVGLATPPSVRFVPDPDSLVQ